MPSLRTGGVAAGAPAGGRRAGRLAAALLPLCGWGALCALPACRELAPSAQASTETAAQGAAPHPVGSAARRAKRARGAGSAAPGAASAAAALPATPAAATGSAAPTPAASAGGSATPAGSDAPTASATPAGSGAPGASAAPLCPADMAVVSGLHCRNVEQRCLEYVKGQDGEDDLDRCQRFEQPSVCLDTEPRRPMNFCMDRYEWPNQVGELPSVLVDWTTARALCEDKGKRLCTESEFTFACEGEEMRPYAVGFERDDDACNIDAPFLRKRVEMMSEPLCMASPRCRDEFERLDQRGAIGERPRCVSPFGIHDLNGNVNEWVSQLWKQHPKRSALKGGWWGPVRNRCRAIALSHQEDYAGYEVGFRCCQDVATAKKPKR